MVAKHTHEAFRGILALLFALMILGGSASAQLNKDGVDPEWYDPRDIDLFVDRPLFEDICEILNLSDAQRNAAEGVFEKYFEDLKALEAELKKRIDQAGYAEFKELANQSRRKGLFSSDFPWDRMRPLLAKADKERVRGRQETDALLERFYADLQPYLTDEQKKQMVEVRRQVRLERFERRAREFVDQGTAADFQPGFVLLDDLIQQTIEQDSAISEALTTNADQSLREPVRKILKAYEIARDREAQRWYAENREPGKPHEFGPRATVSDSRVARWNRKYNDLRRAINNIGAIIEKHAGIEAYRAWMDKFRHAMAPNLLGERWPDRIPAFVESLDDVTPEQRKAIDAIYQAYARERDRLHKQMFRAGIDACRKHARPESATPPGLKYARRQLQFEALIESTIDELQAVLTPPQQALLENKIKQARRQDPDLFEVWVRSEAVAKALDIDLEPQGVLLVRPYEYDYETGEMQLLDDSTKNENEKKGAQ